MSITLARTQGGIADTSVTAPDKNYVEADPLKSAASATSTTVSRWNGGDFVAGHNDTLIEGPFKDAKSVGTLNAAAVTRVDH